MKSPNKLHSIATRGFTIVELLIVVVVIAILAAITIVAYNGITANARESALKSELSSVGKDLMLAGVESGMYPSSAPDSANKLANNEDYVFNYYQRDGGASFCIDIQYANNDSLQFYFDKTKGRVEKGLCDETGSGGHVAVTPGYCFQTRPVDGGVAITQYRIGQGLDVDNAEWIVWPFGNTDGYGYYSTSWIDAPECGYDVTIPSEINGSQVVAIGLGDNNLFVDQLTSLVIPNSVTSIDTWFNTSSLNSIHIGNGVQSLDWLSGSNLQNLHSLHIGNGVQSLVWFDAPNLRNLHIGSGISRIEEGQFFGGNITALSLSEGLEFIGMGAFAMNQIQSVVIPSSVQSIGEYAFYSNPWNGVDDYEWQEGDTDEDYLNSLNPGNITCNIPNGKSFSNTGCVNTVYY